MNADLQRERAIARLKNFELLVSQREAVKAVRKLAAQVEFCRMVAAEGRHSQAALFLGACRAASTAFATAAASPAKGLRKMASVNLAASDHHQIQTSAPHQKGMKRGRTAGKPATA